MTLPVTERIAAEVATRLASITTDNGYTLTASVQRPTRMQEDAVYQDKTVVVMQGDQVRIPELDCYGNPPALCYRLNFNIHGIRRTSEKLDTVPAHQTQSNELSACIVKAITAETNWYIFDDCSINAELGNPSPFISPAGDYSGETIPLAVIFRVSEDDPYEARG